MQNFCHSRLHYTEKADKRSDDSTYNKKFADATFFLAEAIWVIFSTL